MKKAFVSNLKMKKLFNSILYFIFIGLIFTSVLLKAQTTPTGGGTTTSTPVNATPGNVSGISDAQLGDLMQKAQASGMSDQQIKDAAAARGYSDADINSLQGRINTLRSANSQTLPQPADAVAKTNNVNAVSASGKANVQSAGSGVFGAELFNNSNLTFEPNLRIPTPQNYLLGPDDQLIINVYGNSQVDWRLLINPDGNIQIPGIGLVYVGSKTIEQASALIKAKLIANHYAIGNGTNVAVSLGNIRSIKVMLVGEVARPGTYTISSLSTVFNALYVSGGPGVNGSFRQIEVIRDNALIRKLDIYDFLLKADQRNNIQLKDGDIIRIPTYNVKVTLTGEVKRPGIYEVLPGETLHNVINFAGGFNEYAFTSTIKVIQLTPQDRRITDIKAADFDNYIPLRADHFVIDRIFNSFENRVTIAGAVYRPGAFELTAGLTVSQLIAKAAGLTPDAFTKRAFISRLKSDNTTQIIAFDIKAINEKTSPDILLKKEDVVSISSIFDLRDSYSVTINGEVRSGGNFNYVDSMTVEDLIIQAGGFTEGASTKRIAIARRITDSDPGKKNSAVSQVFTIDVDKDFKLSSASFKLQPFDIVSVYDLPGYERQRTVKIEGEVYYPGFYTITTKDEKISDLIKRAGGLTALADLNGGRLERVDELMANADKGKTDVNQLNQERYNRLSHIQRTLKDSTNTIFDQINNQYVGIDIKKVLSKPGSADDLNLMEGDVLYIPQMQQLVKVNGEVLFPSSTVYTNSKSFSDYIGNAGGYSTSALRRRIYVVYANGSVKATHSIFFFKSYPTIKPGSEIVVPKKPQRTPVTATEIGAIAASLTSAASVLIGIITLSKL